MSSFENISINGEPVNDHIVEDFFSEFAWCYQKYKSGLIHIYRSATSGVSVNCNQTYDNIFNCNIMTYDFSIPNANITQICSWLSSIHVQGSNGIFWIIDRSLDLVDVNGLQGIKWAWFVASARNAQVSVYPSVSCWARYEPVS